MTRYIAFVEADGGVGFDYDGDTEEAKEYLKRTLNTGDLGPPKVRGIEVDE